jgi:hypothetical protein
MKTFTAVAALVLSAVASPARAQLPGATPGAAPGDTVVTMTVTNDRDVPVTVFMDYGAFDRRLGRVQPRSTATLRLPGWVVRESPEIGLFVHPEGGEDLQTAAFRVVPGQKLTLHVPAGGGMTSRPAPDTMMAVLPPEVLAEATITVDNPRAQVVTVYAAMGQFDVRLGRVAPHSRETLRFPRAVVLPDMTVRVFVHPERGSDLATQELDLRHGQHLGLHVPVR